MKPVEQVYELPENSQLARSIIREAPGWTLVDAIFIDVGWTAWVAAIPDGAIIYIGGVRPDCRNRLPDESRRQWLLDMGPSEWGSRHCCSGMPQKELVAGAADRGERQPQLEEDD